MDDRKPPPPRNSSRTLVIVAVAVLVVIAIAGIVLGTAARAGTPPTRRPRQFQRSAARLGDDPGSAPAGRRGGAVAEPDRLRAGSRPAPARVGQAGQVAETAPRRAGPVGIVSAKFEAGGGPRDQMELAKKRAFAVRQALEANGVPFGTMRIEIAEMPLGLVRRARRTASKSRCADAGCAPSARIRRPHRASMRQAVVDVTGRIRERSGATRRAYLARIDAMLARPRGPERLGCANLAHATAACRAPTSSASSPSARPTSASSPRTTTCSRRTSPTSASRR